MAESTWSFSQEFSGGFQASCVELATRIEAAKSSSPTQDVLQNITVDLAKMTKNLAEATGSLPSYDQRQYENQLKSYERDLQDLKAANAPKSKFSFKRKVASASKTESVAPPPSVTILSDSETISANLTLSKFSYRYLTSNSLSGPLDKSDLTISDLDNCVVNLLPENDTASSTTPIITALHVRNLSKTVLLLPIINGSALLHDLSQCLIILGCHQFRMHTSQNVDVHISISSNPIIEHCQKIRFAQYPHKLQPASESLKLEKPLDIQDFSHIRSTPSPNWSLITSNDESITEWLTTVIDSKQVLTETIAMVLPSCL